MRKEAPAEVQRALRKKSIFPVMHNHSLRNGVFAREHKAFALV